MSTEKTATVKTAEKSEKTSTVKTAEKTAPKAAAPKTATKKAEKPVAPVNPNEKTYRVVFKKNAGVGKRTRVVMKAESVEALMEAIDAKAKADRMRPMRVQEMDGTKVATKFRIKATDGELDLVKAKARKLAGDVAEDEKKIAKVEKAKAPAKVTKPVAAKTVKPVAKAEKVEAPVADAKKGVEFDVE